MEKYLVENSFYQTDDESQKQTFIKDREKMGNAFWINFLGISALYNKDKDHFLLKQYLRQKVQIKSITDESNDLILIIKLLNDEGLIRQVNEYTRYLALLKKGKIDKVNEDLLRELLKKVRFQLVPVNTRIKTYIKGFLDGSNTLENIDNVLYNFAKKEKICDEYRNMFRRIKGDTDDDLTDQDGVTDTEEDKDSEKEEIEETRIFLDNINPGDIDVPWSKDNKLLQKFFFVFLLRLNSMAGARKILSKNGITANDVMNNITNDDILDMEKNDFPKNNPIVSKLDSFYKTTANLFSINTQIGKLFNSNMFTTRGNFINFIKIFPYKRLKELYIAYHGIPFLERQMDASAWLFKNKDIEITQEIEKRITDSYKYVHIQDTDRLFYFADKTIADKFLPVFIKHDLPLLPDIERIVYNTKTQEVIRKMFANGTVEKYYEKANEKERENIKKTALVLKLTDDIDFIDITADDMDVLYNNFYDYMVIYDSWRDKTLTDPYEYALKRKFLDKFMQEFETSIWDDYLMAASSGKVEHLVNCLPFLLKRKRKFNLTANQVINIGSRLDFYGSNKKDLNSFCKFLFDLIKEKNLNLIKLYPGLSGMMKFLPSKDIIDMLKNHITADFHITVGMIESLDLKDIIDNRDFLLSNRNTSTYTFIIDTLEYHKYLIITVDDIIEAETPNGYNELLTNRLWEQYFQDIEPRNEVLKIRQWISDNFVNKRFWIQYKYDAINNQNYIDILKRHEDELKNNSEFITSLIDADENSHLLLNILDEDEFADAMNQRWGLYILKNNIIYLKKPENIKKVLNKYAYSNAEIFKKPIPQLLNDYNFIEVIDNIIETATDDEFDDVVKSMFPDKSDQAINMQLKNTMIQKGVVNEIFHSENAPIKPLIKSSPKIIRKVLIFNEIDTKGIKVRKIRNERSRQYYNRLKNSDELKEFIEPLKIDKIEETPEQLEMKTVEYAKYNNGRHGNCALEFLESFNVDMITDEFIEFINENPDPIIIPAFHGTGSVAASMILRYGFKILPKTDDAVVGRMLGDGIYFSNVLEKASQYIGDTGFSRRTGTIGYILEMEAYIGQKEINHKSEGLGGTGILSPEWCVFDPRSQLKIVKAHQVKMTTKQHIKNLENKYKTNEGKSRMNFFDYMNEEKTKGKNVIHYIFYQENVYDYNGKQIDFEIFKNKYSNNKNINIMSGQKGPVIVLNTDAKVSGSVHIPYTDTFKETNPNGLYDQYITILKGILRK